MGMFVMDTLWGVEWREDMNLDWRLEINMYNNLSIKEMYKEVSLM